MLNDPGIGNSPSCYQLDEEKCAYTDQCSKLGSSYEAIFYDPADPRLCVCSRRVDNCAAYGLSLPGAAYPAKCTLCLPGFILSQDSIHCDKDTICNNENHGSGKIGRAHV